MQLPPQTSTYANSPPFIKFYNDIAFHSIIATFQQLHLISPFWHLYSLTPFLLHPSWWSFWWNIETSPIVLLLHLAKNKRYTQTPKTPKKCHLPRICKTNFKKYIIIAMFMDKLNTYNIFNKHWMQINICEGRHLCSV